MSAWRGEFNRRHWLKMAALLGVPVGAGCRSEPEGYWDIDVQFDGEVIVVGAGAAGLAAGYLLDRHNIPFRILEASGRVGGRVSKLSGFADFPIDVGAEWIHDSPRVLAELVDDPSVNGSIETVRYSPETLGTLKHDRIRPSNWLGNYYGEYKFHSTTWFDFLETYFLPASAERLSLNTPIERIEWAGERVRVHDRSGEIHEADRLLLAVPTLALKEERIDFEPALSDSRRELYRQLTIPPGLKAFFRMKEKFYPDLIFADSVDPSGEAPLFYDAAFRKDTRDAVLGYFHVGKTSASLTGLSDEQIAQELLQSLDRATGGEASRQLIATHVQNWVAEEFIGGSYVTDYEQDDYFEDLSEPLDDKVYFASDSLSRDATSTVHGAMFSAYDAVRSLLETRE